MASAEPRNHHYVPQWYQRRFLLPELGSNELLYLDLHPASFRDGRGVTRTRKALRRLGTKYCFAEDDFYTAMLPEGPSTAIERYFFGEIDDVGKDALELFSSYDYKSVDSRLLRGFLTYMGTQKFRTPKGLSWLSAKVGSRHREDILGAMVRFRDLYRAVWIECIWSIADTRDSDVQFIVTDHPVTVYNRACGPRSRWCRGVEDPDVLFHATHTLFPLSGTRILILTNHSWATNPYQSELGRRPNQTLERDALFNFTDIQTQRHLTTEEVLQINFILKARAYRYIASPREEWLYPERFVSKSDWATFGDGYLLMPDPRALNVGVKAFVGYADGRTAAFDEQGRHPWDKDYDSGDTDESRGALYRFQGEFARRYGPRRRGRVWDVGRIEPEIDNDDFHEYHLRLEEEGRGRLLRARSRQLQRRR